MSKNITEDSLKKSKENLAETGQGSIAANQAGVAILETAAKTELINESSGAKPRGETSEQTRRLTRTGADLKKALEAWDQLSLNLDDAGALSSDEQMLQDMQKLLKQLQSKIEEFNR